MQFNGNINLRKEHVCQVQAIIETCKVENTYLLTTISSPTPVAKHNEPATLVAIFSRGRVTIGRPAQSTSVPVVCALHSGLREKETNSSAWVESTQDIAKGRCKRSCNILTCQDKDQPRSCVWCALVSSQHLWK